MGYTKQILVFANSWKDGEPKLLDVVSIPFLQKAPLPYQDENHLIEPNCPWTQESHLEWKDIEDWEDWGDWCDYPSEIWAIGYDTRSEIHVRGKQYPGINNRVPKNQLYKDGASLYLLSLECMKLLVGEKHYRPAVRACFHYNGIEYCMDVTDPAIKDAYPARGEYLIKDIYVCVSLGEEYRGNHYKLVAGILHEGLCK